MREIWVRSLGREDPLEKEMATHSSILTWRIPWREEPGGLQSTGLQRVGYDWATSLQGRISGEYHSAFPWVFSSEAPLQNKAEGVWKSLCSIKIILSWRHLRIEFFSELHYLTKCEDFPKDSIFINPLPQLEIPELGRSPGEGKGYPLQYCGLENSMDCTVIKSQTWLSNFHFSLFLRS